MPFALIIAFAASIGLHAVALFVPEINLSTEPESLPLMAEIKPLPQSQSPVQPVVKTPEKTSVKHRSTRRKADTAKVTDVAPTPVMTVPGVVAGNTVSSLATDAVPKMDEPLPEEALEPIAPLSENESVLAEPRLPPRGKIRYRVDRGDMSFEIGFAEQEWEIADGRYRLRSVVETTGLIWLFKAYRIDMESQGVMTAEGLRPEKFSIRRNGQETKEKAVFDWGNRRVRVGDQAEQSLDYGAQDLLSFNYQLGFLPHPEKGGILPIATGKKYGLYHLEVVGDEVIETPAGMMRTLHLRAPGENMTELWLAYDHLLLPVKIRHGDTKGGSFVQVATKIQLSPE